MVEASGRSRRSPWRRVETRPDATSAGPPGQAGRTCSAGRVLDGALANPFAHAVMQVLAIARRRPRLVEVERYRAHDIEVDDTAALRLTFDGGLQALVAVTLCAEEFVAGEITVTGTAATAVLEYPTDRLRGPADPALRPCPDGSACWRIWSPTGATPRSRWSPRWPGPGRSPQVLGPVTAAPVRAIDHGFLRSADDLPRPRLVIDGINAVLRQATASLALFSELSVPWALPVVAALPMAKGTPHEEAVSRGPDRARARDPCWPTRYRATTSNAAASPATRRERAATRRATTPHGTGGLRDPAGQRCHRNRRCWDAFQAGDVLVVAAGEDHHLVSQGPLPLLSAWMHLTPAGLTTS